MRLSNATHRLITALLFFAALAGIVVLGSCALGVRPW